MLRFMIEELSDGRAYTNQLTADEQRIIKDYLDAWRLVPTPQFDEPESRRLSWVSPSAKWTRLQNELILDRAFTNELLDRFFSPAWKSTLLAFRNHKSQVRLAEVDRRVNAAHAAYAAHSTPGTWHSVPQDFVLISVGLLILTSC